MAVSTTNAYSGPYTTNGVTTVFPFTFTAPTADEVAVVLVDASGQEIAATGYSVSLSGDSGGSVTFSVPPVAGYSLYALLDPSFRQEIAFENGSAWRAEPVNEGYDRSAIRDQALKRDIDRGMLVPLGEGIGILPGAEARKGSLLAFNEVTGDPEPGFDIASAGTVAGAVADLITVAASIEDVGVVSGQIGNVVSVGESIADVNIAANNIAAILAAPDHAADAIIAAGFDTRADAITFAPKMAAGEGTHVRETDVGDHLAVVGEVKLDGTPATVVDMIPNEGDYTKQSNGALWRTRSSERQLAAGQAAISTTKAAEATATLARTGVSSAAPDVQIIGDTSPSNNNGLPVTTSYGLATPCPADGTIGRVAIKFNVASTGKLIVVDAIGRVVAESAVVSFGANSTSLVALAATLAIKKGQFLHYMRVTGQTPWAATGSIGRQFDNATYTGVGNLVTVVATTNRIALTYELSTVGKTLATQIVGNTDALATFTDQAVTDQLQIATPKYVANTTQISASFKSYSRRFDVGVNLSAGMSVDRINTAALTNSSATQFYWRVVRRLLSSPNINSYAPIAEDELVASGYASFSSLGITAGRVWRGSIPVDRFQPAEGYAYFPLLNVLDANGTTFAFGMGDGPTTDTGASVGMRRGAYGTGNDASSGMYGVNQEIALTFGGFLPERASVFDSRVEQATAFTSDLTVTIKGQLARNGLLVPLATTHTLGALVNTATNSTWARYDVVYVNLDDMTYGVQVGVEGLYDAGERIPALPTGNLQALFNCRVSFTGVEAVPVWAVFDGEHRDVVDQLEQERRRFRRLIPRLQEKIHSSTGMLGYMSLGMSIPAIGDTDNGGTFDRKAAPNGTRDRGRVYLSNGAAAYLPGGSGTANLGSDIIESLPLYTAAQIGRTDTLGLGAVFTKFGTHWAGINAIEARGLRSLGSSLNYVNYSIGGTKTTDLWASGAPTTWLVNAKNYAVANSIDAIAIDESMNELAADATRANLVSIINYLRSGTNIEIIVMGAWRPRQASIFANWDKVSREVRQAAYETNVAFHSRRAAFDDKYIGSVGISAVDVCATNISNHPAIREHMADGLAFAKTLVG